MLIDKMVEDRSLTAFYCMGATHRVGGGLKKEEETTEYTRDQMTCKIFRPWSINMPSKMAHTRALCLHCCAQGKKITGKFWKQKATLWEHFM